MKLLLDANLSPRVTRLLKEAGHDAIHVADIGLLTATDPVILRAAAKEERILLTADSDFGALLALGSLASPSLLEGSDLDLVGLGERTVPSRSQRPHRGDDVEVFGGAGKT